MVLNPIHVLNETKQCGPAGAFYTLPLICVDRPMPRYWSIIGGGELVEILDRNG